MFYSLGRVAYTHRRIVIAAWLIACAISAPFILRLPSVLEVGGFSNPEIEAARARQLLEEQVPAFSASVLVIIFESDDLRASDPAYAVQAQEALADVVAMPEVISVVSFIDNPRQISTDGRTAYTMIRLAPSPEESQRLMPEVRERLADTDLDVTFAGAPAFYEDVERISEQDLRRAEAIAIPFALVGSVWLLWLLDYRLSTAVWVGIIALVGLAAQTGIVMILYIDHAYERRRRAGKVRNLQDIIWAHMEGTVMRVRPKLMTVSAMLMGLVPLLWADGSGADVMKRIAAPMVGGLVTSFALELLVYPAIFAVWKGRALARASAPARARP